MKIFAYITVALVASAVLNSCSKKDDPPQVNPEYTKKAEDFKVFVQAKNFRIKNYYSDKPIDYIEDDNQVKSETELWQYVSPWLKDDNNVFDPAAGTVTITQNAEKIPSDASATITKNIRIFADNTGPYFDFLSHEYQPLRYHLVDFADNYFIVYADWHSGEKVYTRFEVVAP